MCGAPAISRAAPAGEFAASLRPGATAAMLRETPQRWEDRMAESKPAALQIPAREIPVPAHLSPEAQAWLSMPRPAGMPADPALDDAEGWRRRIAASDAMIMNVHLSGKPLPEAQVTPVQEDEARG